MWTSGGIYRKLFRPFFPPYIYSLKTAGLKSSSLFCFFKFYRHDGSYQIWVKKSYNFNPTSNCCEEFTEQGNYKKILKKKRFHVATPAFYSPLSSSSTHITTLKLI